MLRKKGNERRQKNEEWAKGRRETAVVCIRFFSLLNFLFSPFSSHFT
jgi:hypothetical protein